MTLIIPKRLLNSIFENAVRLNVFCSCGHLPIGKFINDEVMYDIYIAELIAQGNFYGHYKKNDY